VQTRTDAARAIGELVNAGKSHCRIATIVALIDVQDTPQLGCAARQPRIRVRAETIPHSSTLVSSTGIALNTRAASAVRRAGQEALQLVLAACWAGRESARGAHVVNIRRFGKPHLAERETSRRLLWLGVRLLAEDRYGSEVSVFLLLL
jgi:hypothetical protein